MSSWNIIPIKNLGRVVTGKTPPTGIQEYFGGNELFVSPKDLRRDSSFVSDTETKITPRALDKFKGQVIPKNSVMFTSLSFAFGKMGITTRSCITNQQINTVVPNAKHNYRFVYYLLKTYESIIFSYNSGIDTPIVPKSVFEKIQVRCPDLDLQKKIAAVLSTYDDLIENNRRRIELLEQMAEELYREWFVRFRFPGYQQCSLEKGIPRGWKLVKLADAFSFTGGGTPARNVVSYWGEGTVNWFTPSDITASKGVFLNGSSEQCSDEGLANSSARIFPAYSVMMTSRATIGAIGINLTPACTNQGFITCIPNDSYPLTYLYHWLKLSKSHFESLSTGATFPELTKGVFKKIEILTPPKILVGKFQKLASVFFTEIESLQRANAELHLTRSLLLTRLISGKLPVDQLNIQFPPSMREANAARQEVANA